MLTGLSFVLVLISPLTADAKGGGGGGHSSGGSHSSVSRSSAPSSRPSAPSSKPSTPAPKPSTPATKPAAPKPPAPSKAPTATTPKVTAAAPKTVNGKTYSKTGNVVGAGYQPRFRGGVVPSAGSVVYYQTSNDWMMWIPLLYLMNNDSHRDAVVETPGQNGAATTTQVVQEEGTDSMYVWNWIITIVAGLGLAALIVWAVNYFTTKKKSYV